MNIGNKLKSLRIEKGFQPLDMAEKLNISETTYRRYERNESSPDIKMLEKIANLYDISINDIIKEDKYVFYNSKNKGDNIGNVVINQLSEKLNEQYELRLKEKDELIRLLQEQNSALKEEIVLLKKPS
jgi:transcriptional regulator with XRE-family HTH domain